MFSRTGLLRNVSERVSGRSLADVFASAENTRITELHNRMQIVTGIFYRPTELDRAEYYDFVSDSRSQNTAMFLKRLDSYDDLAKQQLSFAMVILSPSKLDDVCTSQFCRFLL